MKQLEAKTYRTEMFKVTDKLNLFYGNFIIKIQAMSHPDNLVSGLPKGSKVDENDILVPWSASVDQYTLSGTL